MPNWAAAPKIIILGLESSGPKSIIAPMPMKSRMGSASDASISVWKSHWMMPGAGMPPWSTWSSTPEKGRFTRMAPKPIGMSRAGSNPFSIAR